jgi:hypothetical protein
MPRCAESPRTCRFVVMLTQEERTALRKCANDEGTTESELIRRRTFAAADAIGDADAPVAVTVTVDARTARRLMGQPIKPKDA